MKRLLSALGLLALLFTSALHAEDPERIVFATAPTHSEEETRRLYTPLMRYLSETTGKEFILETARNFIEYSTHMRNGDYDMIFDGPHLVGWRMDNLDHTPIVRFPGTIRIVVVAKETTPINSMKELERGQARVCAFTSPNMLTMAFLSYFPNPVRQPRMLRVQGFKGLVECLRSGRGDVAVLRDKLWNKVDQTGLKLVAAPSVGYPERTFSVSSKLSTQLRKQIQEAMLSEEGINVSRPIRERFKKKTLIAAKPIEYQGLAELLTPVWGFHTSR